jgi:hypothetical protein
VDDRCHPGALRDVAKTGKRSDLAGHAGYGYCTSHSRQVLAALLEHHHHLIRTGQILLADKGFAGAEFTQITDAMGLRLLRPDRKDETYHNGNLGGVGQWIESVNQTLQGQLDLEDHGGRTPAAVFTRVTQRLLALTAGIWHNWTTGITSKRSLTAHDHQT